MSKFTKSQPPGAFGGIDLPVIQPRIVPEEEPYVKASEVFGASAPAKLTDAYIEEFKKHRTAGKDGTAAHARAIAKMRHAGWRNTKDGWKKVLPDMSDKIRMAEFIPQGDDTYYVEHVPVFYPNAVKGPDQGYSHKDLKRFIENTNAVVGKMGEPVITEGHPNEIQGAIGKQLDAKGRAVNWSMGSDKIVYCDFDRVQAPYVERMKKGELPAVSAGFAKDTHGLNKRFGHVALLGGTSPALSHLPATEYFSVSGNYLCFSADTESIPRKDGFMLSQKTKDCYAAFEAAEESQKMGQPDADARMKEAYAAYRDAAKADFEGDGTPAPGSEAMEPMPPTEGGEATTGAYDAAENKANGGIVPAVTPMGSPVGAFKSIQDIKDMFASPTDDMNPAHAFNALADYAANQGEIVKQLAQANEVLRLKDRANTNRSRVEKFDATVEAYRRSGRVLPPPGIVKKNRDACFASADPDKSLASLLELFEAYPPKATPATFNAGGAMFSANDSQPKNGKRSALTMHDLAGTKERLSPEDMAFAALSETIEG